MGASKAWKVFDRWGELQATCKDPRAAVALVSFYGDGATIRRKDFGRDVVLWTEGAPPISSLPMEEALEEVCANSTKAYSSS